jgi:probable F420-dependent oxidoreductase
VKFGLFGINMGPCSTPTTALRVARAAEDAGFESLWTGEHVVLPDPQVAPSPLPPDFPLLDPVVAFAFLAGHTRTIRLGTGIIILPQRNPLVLAKELASLDVLSGGRLIFGVGIGYLKPEFDALGIPFDDKGARTVEYLQAMQAIWNDPRPAYRGKLFSFGGVQAQPRPAQRPHPPIVFGGMTPFAFGRAVGHGNGWYGFALDLEGTRRCLAGLREAAKRAPRPKALGELEISVTPSVPLDADTVQRFADLGVHRVIPTPRRPSDRQLFPLTLSEDDVVAFVERTGGLVRRD